MSPVNTTIRIDADTQDGVVNVDRLDQAAARLERRLSPAVLGSSLKSTASLALQNTAAFGGMGRGANIVAGAIGILGSSLGAINPLFGIVGLAVGIITTKLLENEETIHKVAAATRVEAEAVVALVNANDRLSVIASRIRDDLVAEIVLERQLLTQKLLGQELTSAEINLLFQKNNASRQGLTDDQVKVIVERTLNSTREESINRVAELNKRLDALAETTRYNTEKEKEAKEVQDAVNAATRDRRVLIEANMKALAIQSEAEKLAAETAMRGIDVTQEQIVASFEERKRIAQEAFANSIDLETMSVAEIVARRNLLLAQLADLDAQREAAIAQHNAKVEAMHRGTTVDLTREYQIREAALQQSINKMTSIYGVFGGAVERLIRGQTALHGGFAAFIVQTTGEAIQATLRIYATLWAAEAAANAITNPAVAASKARAAALAGVAVGIVGAATEVAVSAITRSSEQLVASQTEFSETGADGSTRRGRTLAQLGPINITSSSTFIINGSVYGVTQLFELYQQWRDDELRSLGRDVAEASR